MAIYMFKGTYTDASIKAMVKKPVDRSSLISEACKAFKGKLLSIYMAFGDDDVIVKKCLEVITWTYEYRVPYTNILTTRVVRLIET